MKILKDSEGNGDWYAEWEGIDYFYAWAGFGVCLFLIILAARITI